MERIVYKIVEKKGKIFGLPMADIGLTVLFFFTFLFIIIVVELFTPLSGKFHLINVGMTVLLLGGMKYLNTKKHPSFLLSYLSYKFLQPKKVILQEPKNGKIKQKNS